MAPLWGILKCMTVIDEFTRQAFDIDTRIAAGWTDVAIRRDVLGARPMTHWFSQGEYSPDSAARGPRHAERHTGGGSARQPHAS